MHPTNTLTHDQLSQRSRLASEILREKYGWQIAASGPQPIKRHLGEVDGLDWYAPPDGANIMEYIMNAAYEFRALRSPEEKVAVPFEIRHIQHGMFVEDPSGDWHTILRTDKKNGCIHLLIGAFTPEQLFKDGWSWYMQSEDGSEYCSREEYRRNYERMQAMDTLGYPYDWRSVALQAPGSYRVG